jgi:hypothetical protein
MEAAAARNRPRDVPIPGDKSIFICPNAKLPGAHPNDPPEAPYPVDGTPLYFYFNYVINSKLENGMPARWRINIFSSSDAGESKTQLSRITKPADTVLLFGLRATHAEFPPNIEVPSGGNTLTRIHAKWAEMALRHKRGSSTLFVDGSSRIVEFEYANDEQDLDYIGSRLFPKARKLKGYNQVDLIWSPLDFAR